MFEGMELIQQNVDSALPVSLQVYLFICVCVCVHAWLYGGGGGGGDDKYVYVNTVCLKQVFIR